VGSGNACAICDFNFGADSDFEIHAPASTLIPQACVDPLFLKNALPTNAHPSLTDRGPPSLLPSTSF
jgi:hypothetical protein